MMRATGLGSSSRAGSTAVGCPGSAGGPAAGVSAATGEPVARGGVRWHRVLVAVGRGGGGVGRGGAGDGGGGAGGRGAGGRGTGAAMSSWLHDTGYGPALDHEGGVAPVVEAGTDPDIPPDQVGPRVIGWRAGCQCCWRGTQFFLRAER